MLQSTRSQRVGHDLSTEQQQAGTKRRVFFSFLCLAMLRSMWDLSSPTRDFTRAPYSRGKEKLQSFINESEYPVVEK